jgi:hypothetical protein
MSEETRQQGDSKQQEPHKDQKGARKQPSDDLRRDQSWQLNPPVHRGHSPCCVVSCIMSTALKLLFNVKDEEWV